MGPPLPEIAAHIGTYRAVSGDLNRLSEALDNAGYVRLVFVKRDEFLTGGRI